MSNIFRTKRGKLSLYALSCGYVEVWGDGVQQTTLWREHGVYHVRSHNFEEHKRIQWDTAATLGEARRLLMEHRKLFYRDRKWAKVDWN